MNELSLFSGAGGGLLGTKLLGFRPIGYVEWEPYCQAVLAQRIKDGFLEEAPIFGDIREFVKSGAAREYRGFADVVTAGFPCQPFSVAGKRAGADDERNMWPATADVIREVRPRFAILENVPGLLATGYCERIFTDLAALGFDAKWGVFSAAGVGAPHRRERLFVVAHTTDVRCERYQSLSTSSGESETERRVREPAGSGEDVAVAGGERLPQPRQEPDGKNGQHSRGMPAADSWWNVEPALGRVAHGMANRVDRLKALGNGQVPAVVRRAWRELSESA